MKNKRFLTTFSVAIALAMSVELAATDAVTTFSVDAGYRRGQAKRSIDLNLDATAKLGANFVGKIKHNTKYNLWDIQAWSRTILDNQYYIKLNLGYGNVYKASEIMDCSKITFGGGALTAAPQNYISPFGRKREQKKKHGSACNALFGIGYIFPLNESVAFIPTIGFEHQQMTIKKYMSESNANPRIVSQASPKQKERWSGFFVGLEAPINFEGGIKIIPSIQYTFSKYKTLTSAKPEGLDGRYYYHGSKKGSIIKATLDAFVPINDHWTFDAGYSFQSKICKPKLQTQWVGDSTTAIGVLFGNNNKTKIKINEHSFNIGLSIAF